MCIRDRLENWGEARAAMEVTDETARYMDEVVRERMIREMGAF